MDPNKPITEQKLLLILGRLFPGSIDWDSIFADPPAPPEVTVPPPPPTVCGPAELTAAEIAELRGWIGSSETGPSLTEFEIQAFHRLRKG